MADSLKSVSMLRCLVEIFDSRRPDGDGLLHETVEELPSVGGEATIESEGKFIKIGLQVRRPDRAMVSSI